MIVLHCQARPMRNGLPNPKDYPHWAALLAGLGQRDFVQVVRDEAEPQHVEDVRIGLPLREIADLLAKAEAFISIDSFLPHLASHGPTAGAVLWSVSDPLIFGYQHNLNLLRDRKYLRPRQFRFWEDVSAVPAAHYPPDEAAKVIRDWLDKRWFDVATPRRRA